ncbi:hypothetical protein [Geobacillus subterraneus]|uniref:Uncharacterized protein n=1 Tax=Geobacillus subterraneus TaxID=129338 RepID=A0A679FWC5_9BACL|nr:hypothetical protein [Geobacillus subterraneus]BBW98995.1 hypothetical protein GsuE55_38280 [Geobacillus subterraneus]
MNLKTYFLWNRGLNEREEAWIIDPSEARKVLPTENCILFEDPLTEKQKEKIRHIFSEYEGNLLYLEEVEAKELLQKDEETKHLSFRMTEDYEDADIAFQKEIFSLEERGFLLTSLMNAVYLYEWWDGGNWQQVFLHPDDITKVVVDMDRYVNLDEWDGHNWNTGGLGLHENVHRVYSVSGSVETDAFLVWRYSQWQGDHDTAIVFLSWEELCAYLKRIGRDPDDYKALL